MGTYSDEDPNAGVIERTINSIKKVTGLDRNASKAEPKNPSEGGETAQETADREAGEGRQSTNQANGYGN